MKAKEININEIIWAVSERCGISESAIKSGSRDTNTLIARQIAMALAREMTSESFRSIGMAFSRTHATALHANKKIIREMAEGNEKITKIYNYAKQRLDGIIGEDLLGLTPREAELVVKREGKTVRIIMRNGTAIVTQRDYNKQRINVSLVNGVIDEILGSW